MAVRYDGYSYPTSEDVPDIGRWEWDGEMYWGYVAEADKLPTYSDMPPGTLAACFDSDNVYTYSRIERKWYLRGGGQNA